MSSLTGKWAQAEILFLKDYKDLVEETLKTNVTAEDFNMAVNMAVKHRICEIKDIAKEFNRATSIAWKWANHGGGPQDIVEKIAVLEFLSHQATQKLKLLQK